MQNLQGVRDFAYICNEFKNAITMSLLKSILKMVVKAATDSASDWAEEKTSKSTRTPQRSEPMREAPADWEGYFAGILSTEFPQYSVRRNVAVTDLAGYAGRLNSTPARDHRGREYASIAAMADAWGLSRHTVYARLLRNWSLDRALTTPVKKYTERNKNGH